VLFQHVSIASVVHVDAPVRLSSAEIVRRLRPTLDRLGIRANLLEDVTGIRERRLWDGPTQVSDAATMATRKALAASGVPPERIGILINTSVCRNYLEPSTASVVHGALGLPDTCQNFDVGNACLAFLNEITESTIARLSSPAATAEQFRQEFASLTLGSGAAAMVLGRSDLLANGHRYLGGVSRAATEFSHLCRGTMDRMVTDTRTLLDEGLKLAAKTFQAAGVALGWDGGELDELVVHQVSKVQVVW